MNATEIPLATYRLQFNRDFTFRQATEIVPYLAALGISHCYASPYLKARPGSTHGYDIIDHNQLNPEIGTAEEYDQFVEALHQHNMGQILDIVPNHMGVMGADNAWWLDVLENGQASNYAEFFDIDWQPLKDELQGKVLIPVLDDQYGTVLDRGDLKLAFDGERGEFSIYFHQHRFPLDPKGYPAILGKKGSSLAQSLPPDHPQWLELQSLIAAFGHLPGQNEASIEKKAERNRDKEIHKRRLASLVAESPVILSTVHESVAAFNGVPGDSRSFDDLHELIKLQAFRLAYWRVAADDINYRRFFDINDLAGLRMENPEVFESTHRLVNELIRNGKVNGLRIDHPDGLFDPEQYFERLHHLHTGYLVVEKILSADEKLPANWPVNGTTGYDFSNLVNGLFINPSAAAKMLRGYRGFLGKTLDFQEVLYECKKNVMRNALASELNVLANLLSRIALSDRHTCDFTVNRLKDALSEIVANFPVYRTYLTADAISASDRAYVQRALLAAKRQSTAQDTSVFDFIRRVLLEQGGDRLRESYRTASITFAMKLQQFTSPVMAKGLEDTSFYRYHPLISINDVGSNPLEFGVPPEEFHRRNQERAKAWPQAMLATSTHDSKLSEDTRARVNVLSEIPAEWRLKARNWRQLNRRHKLISDGIESPSRNDEYLFYQALVGAWPAGLNEPTDELRGRFDSYMLKVSRESKENTSWANQNQEYEQALSSFVNAVLDNHASQEFFADFLPFQQRVARLGMINSLSQTLIKLTSPGVPDIYQGNEFFEYRLVDPDNRRPVDFALRRKRLCEFASLLPTCYSTTARSLSDEVANGLDQEGRAKLFLTWRTLSARQHNSDLFRVGGYIPLDVQGPNAGYIVAFARRNMDSYAITIVPRLSARFVDRQRANLDSIWHGTSLVLPANWDPEYSNCITGERVRADSTANGVLRLDLSLVMKDFPCALLLHNAHGGGPSA
jgi:(1->4)-alpha-D-glucan 1-alpha-D-glucosylmutase